MRAGSRNDPGRGWTLSKPAASLQHSNSIITALSLAPSSSSNPHRLPLCPLHAGAIDLLMTLYKQLLPTMGGHLCHGGVPDLRRVSSQSPTPFVQAPNPNHRAPLGGDCVRALRDGTEHH